MIPMKNLGAALAMSSLIAAAPTFAATDGTQGSSSTGSTEISVTKQAEMKISGLNDIALTVQGDGSATGSSTACIYRNGTGSYSVTATGSGAASTFSLTDGASGVMPYSVTFSDGTNTPTLTSNTAATNLSGANTLSATCNGGTNATVAVTVSALEFSSAPAGSYTGTLTLVIAPE